MSKHLDKWIFSGTKAFCVGISRHARFSDVAKHRSGCLPLQKSTLRTLVDAG